MARQQTPARGFTSRGFTLLWRMAWAQALAQLRARPVLVRGGPSALAVLAGLLAGDASPGGWGLGGWVVVYVPLFVALDLLLRRGARSQGAGGWSLFGWRAGTWGKAFWLCWLLGVCQAALNGAWVVNTAYIYGHLPLPLAHGANLLGFGSLLGLEVFCFLAVPFLLGWRWPRWGFALVVVWSMAFQTITPRFFYWTFGQLMHPVSALVQIADVVGSGGLNLLLISLHLLLFALLRERYAPGAGLRNTTRRELALAGLGVLALFAGSAGYGVWRSADLARAERQGAVVNLAAVQPNFSLGYLASNPALSHSDRQRNLNGLMDDTLRALERLRPVAGAPTVVVWPESVYPVLYFRENRVRQAVENWVRGRGLHLVLTSLRVEAEGEGAGGGRKIYGSSIHVSPGEEAPEVYDKIALIPFGETIPLGGWFPAFRRAIKAWIPQISEFERGAEHTVFKISPQVRLAPMICFDAFSQTVAIGMAKNGANLGLVLANLAWFGRTNIADEFEFFIKFRAIETRMPILLLSQNGQSWYMNAAGRVVSERLGQFESGALTMPVRIPETFSFYAAHADGVGAFYVLLLATLLFWGGVSAWRGRVAQPSSGRE